jgi:hypothetical protein
MRKGMTMPQRTMIVLVVCISLAVSTLAAHQMESYGLWTGFLTLLGMGLLPMWMANHYILGLATMGAAILFFVVFATIAWKRRSARLTVRFLAILLATTAVVNARGYFTYRHYYPYGWSHCCIKGIGLSLRLNSGDHGERFPSGGRTPEASLSLLLTNYCDLYTLKGKSVRLEVARAAFERNGMLDSNTCDWIYQEGLTESGAPDLAILWDREPGLNHNGGRTRDGGREVLFVDGHSAWYSGSAWTNFMTQQHKLLAERLTQTATNGVTK